MDNESEIAVNIATGSFITLKRSRLGKSIAFWDTATHSLLYNANFCQMYSRMFGCSMYIKNMNFSKNADSVPFQAYHSVLSFQLTKHWSIRSKHQWWVMSCFLISATYCCHLMHSPHWINPNSMAIPEGERSLVLWDLSVLFWNRNVSDHKRLLWPDDQWIPNAIH